MEFPTASVYRYTKLVSEQKFLLQSFTDNFKYKVQPTL